MRPCGDIYISSHGREGVNGLRIDDGQGGRKGHHCFFFKSLLDNIGGERDVRIIVDRDCLYDFPIDFFTVFFFFVVGEGKR